MKVKSRSTHLPSGTPRWITQTTDDGLTESVESRRRLRSCWFEATLRQTGSNALIRKCLAVSACRCPRGTHTCGLRDCRSTPLRLVEIGKDNLQRDADRNVSLWSSPEPFKWLEHKAKCLRRTYQGKNVYINPPLNQRKNLIEKLREIKTTKPTRLVLAARIHGTRRGRVEE